MPGVASPALRVSIESTLAERAPRTLAQLQVERTGEKNANQKSLAGGRGLSAPADTKAYELPPAIGALDPVDTKNVRPLRTADWLPGGAVMREFIMAPEPVTCIMGPYGSGKTTGAFVKGLLCSCVVPKSPIDGVRYARGLVIRDTYRNLEMNTIPSWHERFPTTLGSWRGGSGGEPAKAVIDFELSPGEILHMEVIFAAIGDHNVKTFCDGFQATWCFANAVDALPREFLSFMRPRLGRWPPPQHRPADWQKYVRYWRKLFGDMNAPDLDNWTYGDAENKKPGFVEHVPPGWRLFTQPGGTEPAAENRENLPTDYYETLLAENETWWVNRFVHNKFGYSRSGQPVYPEWNDRLHVAPRPIPFNKNYRLYLGLDAGRDPRAIAVQKTPMGRRNILRELIPESRMGAKRFGQLLSEWLADNFPDADVHAFADPAAFYPTQDSDEDSVWVDTVAEVAEIKIKPAASNSLGPRLEAVRQPLSEMIESEPAVQLDPSCRVLRRGFNSGYRFAKVKVHGDEHTGSDPVKNLYSHPHDALQYVMLGMSDWRALQGRETKRGRTTEEVGWNAHE